ncbi:MAG: hypothetical protein AB7G13_30235 [Lautropia sp.]
MPDQPVIDTPGQALPLDAKTGRPVDRRKELLTARLRWWGNLFGTVMLGVPMLLPQLKEHLPEHWYGVIGTGVIAYNFLSQAYEVYVKSHPYPGPDDSDHAGA